MIRDPIDDILLDLIDLYDFKDRIPTSEEFEDLLTGYGLMIVTIEDPTDMFGIMEDSL